MLRQKIFQALHHEKFKCRSSESQRIETLSDAVFAFSVSLLVVSLEVPQTFGEFRLVITGVLPFFATVAFLFMLWYKQYIFFRHYGMNDFRTILLNLVYLAVVVFFLYPLKFLFSFLLSWWMGINFFPKSIGKVLISYGQIPQLVIFYSSGYFVIWILIYIMHERAMRHSKELELNKYELLYTKKEKRGAFMNAMIGAFSALIAWIGMALNAAAWLSGICYFLIPFVVVFNDLAFKRQLRKAGA